MPKKTYTIGQVARICCVAPRTACSWLDNGILKGHKLVHGDRRVYRDDLVEFMKKYEFSLAPLDEEEWRKILLVGLDDRFATQFMDILPNSIGYYYEWATTVFEAGVMCESFEPCCIIVDMVIGRLESLQIADRLARQKKRHTGRLLMALANEDETQFKQLEKAGYHQVMQKPMNPAKLADIVYKAVEDKKEGK